jgi:deoxyribonuclease IV
VKGNVVMRLGAHVPSGDPIAEAEARGADVVQVFLSAPQSWRKPVPRADAERLRDTALAMYVHAPYLINVASPNPKVRHPSRKALADTLQAAEAIGARGVVVHGGHVGEDGSFDEGVRHWRRALDEIASTVPVLIENTAGGANAMARYVAQIEGLWAGIHDVSTPLGFCLDTCHLHASGEDLVAGTAKILDIVGHVSLLHLNDSRDEAGSGRDRHAALGAGMIDPAALVEVVRLCDTDTVLETPGEVAEHQADLAWIRDRLAVN